MGEGHGHIEPNGMMACMGERGGMGTTTGWRDHIVAALTGWRGGGGLDIMTVGAAGSYSGPARVG